MRILFYTHRFGENLRSGPERHLWNLAEQMVLSGCQVDVATTYHAEPLPVHNFGVDWDTLPVEAEDTILLPGGKHPLRVFRFPARNPLPPLAWWLQRRMQRRWEHEEMAMEPVEPLPTPYEIRYPLLLTGWHSPEMENGRQIRWSMRRSAVQLPPTQNATLHLHGFAPRGISIRMRHNGRWRPVYEGAGFFQINARLDDCPRGTVAAFDAHPVARSFLDPRTRGFKLLQMSFSNAGRIELATTNADHRTIRSQQRQEFIQAYLDRANSRPDFYSAWFDTLRGPRCPGMLHFLHRHAGEYDWVLAGVLPYSVLPQAAQLRRSHKFRLAALPLFHVNDGMYYWKHYLDALRTADVCLANSWYSHTCFFPIINARSIFAGAGVDENAFRDPHISARRFRQNHRLKTADKIILSVGRKNNVKRYRTLIRAVDNIQQTVPCKLVLIGPDEDRMPIPSHNCMYLGSVSQEELLDAYDACTVFALMSESESFGMPFVEAWMREKPVIGNRNCAPVAYLIREGETGLLASDREELETHLIELLTDPPRCESLGRAGFQQASRDHTWPVITRRILDHFESALAK